MSRAEMRRLAVADPLRLIRLIQSDAYSAAHLSYAAEILGEHTAGGPHASAAIACLCPLLTHARAIVREGAVLGLAHHLSDEIATALQRLADQDPSPGAREAAEEVLIGR